MHKVEFTHLFTLQTKVMMLKYKQFFTVFPKIIFYISILFIRSDSPCFWAVHSSSSLWNSNTLFSCSGSENPSWMSLQWWVNRSSRTGGQRKSNPGCLWPLVFSKDNRLLSVKNVAFRLTAPWESMANIDNPFHFLPVRFYGYLYYHCCSLSCIFSTNDMWSVQGNCMSRMPWLLFSPTTQRLSSINMPDAQLSGKHCWWYHH